MAEEFNLNKTGATINELLEKVSTYGMVYKTTLDLAGITNGSLMTVEQLAELNNIIEKYTQGYVVTLANQGSNDIPFRYGVLNVSVGDGGQPVCLSFHDQEGNIIAYRAGGLEEGGAWAVTNKTAGSGGGESNVYTPNIPFADIISGAVTSIDAAQQAEINKLLTLNEKDVLLKSPNFNLEYESLIQNMSNVPILFNSIDNIVSFAISFSRLNRNYTANIYAINNAIENIWTVEINETTRYEKIISKFIISSDKKQIKAGPFIIFDGWCCNFRASVSFTTNTGEIINCGISTTYSYRKTDIFPNSIFVAGINMTSKAIVPIEVTFEEKLVIIKLLTDQTIASASVVSDKAYLTKI